MEEQLRSIFYDPKTGLLSTDKLWKKARSLGIKVKRREVEDFIKNQEVGQVYNRRKIKVHFPLQAYSPFERVQIDLMDMSNNSIKGYNWIFCLVDVYTRYSICIPLKNKSELECTRAFGTCIQEILDLVGYAPKRVDSDKESAFLSRRFKKLCGDYGIEQRFSEINDTKSKGVVERFNRTLRSLIGKYILAYNKRDWVSMLPDIVHNYNNTFHRTLQKSPIEAIDNNEVYEYRRRVQEERARGQNYNKVDMGVGSTVRVKIKKGTFDKEEHQWSKSTHKVERIENGMYYVSDRVHGYKKYELLPVDKVERLIEKTSSDPEAEIQEIRRDRRINRRINKEGVSEGDIVRDENSRVLRRFKPRTDLGFSITDF